MSNSPKGVCRMTAASAIPCSPIWQMEHSMPRQQITVTAMRFPAHSMWRRNGRIRSGKSTISTRQRTAYDRHTDEETVHTVVILNSDHIGEEFAIHFREKK